MKLPAWAHTTAGNTYQYTYQGNAYQVLPLLLFSSFSQMSICEALTVDIIWGK